MRHMNVSILPPLPQGELVRAPFVLEDFPLGRIDVGAKMLLEIGGKRSAQGLGADVAGSMPP